MLAHIDLRTNRTAEARTVMERAVRCYRNALGTEAPLTAKARCKRKTGRTSRSKTSAGKHCAPFVRRRGLFRPVLSPYRRPKFLMLL